MWVHWQRSNQRARKAHPKNEPPFATHTLQSLMSGDTRGVFRNSPAEPLTVLEVVFATSTSGVRMMMIMAVVMRSEVLVKPRCKQQTHPDMIMMLDGIDSTPVR